MAVVPVLAVTRLGGQSFAFVVRQVNGQYKVKDAGLKPLHHQACLLLSRFHEVDVKHVRREQNAEADALVNRAIDAASR